VPSATSLLSEMSQIYKISSDHRDQRQVTSMEMVSMVQPTPHQRRQWITWYFAHDQNISATCAQFGIHRSTLWRWLTRYANQPQKALRARSRRPHTIRQSTWSPKELLLICELLGQHPTWGRGQVRIALMARTGIQRSAATVGRMLTRIRPRCPVCKGRAGHHAATVYALVSYLSQLGVPGSAWRQGRTATDPEVAALLQDITAWLRKQ
jgi:transposase